MAKKRSNDESEINVTIFRRHDKGNYIMQYCDPISGRKCRKTTGTDNLREANKIRDKWQASVLAGTIPLGTNGLEWTRRKQIDWAAFRLAYEENKLSSLAPKTQKKYEGVLNVFERVIAPRKLSDVNADTLDVYQSKLRRGGWREIDLKKAKPRSEHSIKSHMNTLRAVLSWAKIKGWIREVPQMPNIQQAKGLRAMKGRPITKTEFNKMLNSVRKVIVKRGEDRTPDEKRIPSWKHYLEGLWFSGLRLSESLNLSWDDRSKICVDFTGRRPMFHIPQGADKSKSDKVLPMAPEFAIWLEENTPKSQRTGFVFNPLPQRGSKRFKPESVSVIVSRIGEAACVVVNDKTGAFASAHDLRRSFGQRWKSKLMPSQLAELMRHGSIQTTMKFYIVDEAEETADALWAAFRFRRN